MNVRRPYGVSHSFSIKNIFCDKMDLRLLYFPVTVMKDSVFRQVHCEFGV